MGTKAPELETWRNATQGRLVVKQHNTMGQLEDVIVGAQRVVHITPTDRRINQEQSAGPTQDMFQNGFMAPVALLDGEFDTAKLSENPNVITEEDMTALFSADFGAFCSRLDTITLPITLQRMLRIAGDIDEAQVRQVNAIKARIAALVPPTHTEIEQVAVGEPGVGRVVQPR